MINLCNFCLSVLPPCLSNSGGILSEPAALFSFSLLIIKHISLYHGSGICDGLFVSSLIMFCISVASDILNMLQK